MKGSRLPPTLICLMMIACAWMAVMCGVQHTVLHIHQQRFDEQLKTGMPLSNSSSVANTTKSRMKQLTVGGTSNENRERGRSAMPDASAIDPSTSILVLVLSARSHWEQRMAIRRTWGSAAKHSPWCQVYFVIDQGCAIPKRQRKSLECALDDKFARAFGRPGKGSPTDSALDKEILLEDKQLRKEQLEHSDLIFTDRSESYRGLPNKLKVGYSFATTAVNNVEWILKADDDMFVRLDVLNSYLSGSNLSSSTMTVVGRIKYEQPVVKRGKWAELHTYRSKHILSNGTAVYPPFPLGSAGHVVSRPVAKYVASSASNLSDYQGEDVSLGIWLDSVNLHVTFHRLDNRYHDVHGECERQDAFLVGHRLTPSRLEECWNIVQHDQSTF